MKKILTCLTILITSTILVSCQNKIDSEKNIYISATAKPHAEILEEARPLLEEKGYKLKVIITDAYDIPNKAVASKSVDANFFQHEPFLANYNKNATVDKQIVNVANIHIEPIGIYSKKFKSLTEIADNSVVVASSSVADHGRLLRLLENVGLIKIKENLTKDPTIEDITENLKNLTFNLKVAPELLTITYNNDVKAGDIFLINGNYALSGGLNPKTDAIALESSENNPYRNLIGVLSGREELPKIQALVAVMTSEHIKKFINEKYQGQVVPV